VSISRRRSCRRSHHLRRALRRAQKAATRCGEVDEGCVDRTYRRITRLRARLAKSVRRCSVTGTATVGVTACAHVPRVVARLRRRRVILQARVPNCGSEDNACVTSILRRVLRINRKIRANNLRCKVSPLDVVTQQATCPKPLQPLQWVHSNMWKHSITCNEMQAKWKTWLAFTKERRRRLHCESCRCDPLDVSCLRMAFVQIVHVNRQVRDARTRFANMLRVCDRCAPLKLRFRRWLHRQRARRLRLHLEICRCRVDDVNCAARRVQRIKNIQQNIRLRRQMVMALHKDCHTTTLAGQDMPLPGLHHAIASGAATIPGQLPTGYSVTAP